MLLHLGTQGPLRPRIPSRARFSLLLCLPSELGEHTTCLGMVQALTPFPRRPALVAHTSTSRNDCYLHQEGLLLSGSIRTESIEVTQYR